MGVVEHPLHPLLWQILLSQLAQIQGLYGQVTVLLCGFGCLRSSFESLVLAFGPERVVFCGLDVFLGFGESGIAEYFEHVVESFVVLDFLREGEVGVGVVGRSGQRSTQDGVEASFESDIAGAGEGIRVLVFAVSVVLTEFM